MSKALKVVNHLQSVPLEVSAEMVEIQRIAWDNGIDGLYPCAKVPKEVPDRLGPDPSEEALRERNNMARLAYRDQEINRPKRIRIERSIQFAEAMAGETIYQAWNYDYRSRAYTVNRYLTHQGSDPDKALLSFLPQLPVNEDGIDWLLKAAAGHWGMSRNSWSERLQWGQDHRQAMVAAAEDPLGRLELWRSAKDPWQFLQTCRGLREALTTGATGVPIRLDQTSSGPGILASLMRDRKLARLCNVWGNSPKDLYGVVAEGVVKRLQHDQQFYETPAQRALSQVWLDYGVTRSTVKPAVLSAPYGARHMSITDQLVDLMAEHVGPIPLSEFAFHVAIPARYLARHVWAEVKEFMKDSNELQRWLKLCTKKVMSQPAASPLEWTMPMGWPMKVADREQTITRVYTQLYGKKISVNLADQPVDAPLSYRNANRSIAANFIHAMDASFMQAIVYRAAERSIPILTNHDAFSIHPSHASMTHQMLCDEMRRTYAADWLQMWHQEMQDRSGKTLPIPPMVDTLCPGEIGQNPYLFS
jgi:DNA-directed RNA polymerase